MVIPATLSKRVDSLITPVEGSGTNISLREEMDALGIYISK